MKPSASFNYTLPDHNTTTTCAKTNSHSILRTSAAASNSAFIIKCLINIV